MKFATFEKDGQQLIGLVVSELGLLMPLQISEQKLLGTSLLPATMNEFLDMGDAALDVVAKIMQACDGSTCWQLSDVKLLAPIPRPRKNVFCIGKNYAEHVKELATLGTNLPEHPIFFTKPPTAVVGTGAVVKNHKAKVTKMDYEAELAVIIGKTASNVSKENAYDYVFGYTALNDVSARDLQARHIQWLMGKAADTFCPMGPWIVCKKEMGDINNIAIQSRINGEVRQNGNTSQFIFDIPTIIETLTSIITLEPGDIIATGTPAGVGMGFNPPRLLNPGDVMEIEIEKIGTLVNTIEK